MLELGRQTDIAVSTTYMGGNKLKAGYSDFWSFKIKCIIKYKYVLVIQKKYYEKLFLHIKGYTQFQRFF